MNPDEKPRKTKDIDDRAPHGGKTRRAEEPIDAAVAKAYNDVQPNKFKGDPHTAVDQSVSDPDVEDTEGGE